MNTYTVTLTVESHYGNVRSQIVVTVHASTPENARMLARTLGPSESRIVRVGKAVQS